ncbi:site-2 protease family protein [Salinarimonas rosea]|uniref:site-2 protease family protein n=1 Tax=Salinarimonas rosea TaxID=552063 RepID=UPI00041A6D17|nr:site-2 protease family protein [Salinarimonas rosea]
MVWSFPIGVIAGTVVKIHVTFVLFLVWIAGAAWRAGGFEAALTTTLFVLLLFACVLAHEFGHIFAARRYGIRTPSVILSPIGGIASLERIPEDPRQELVVAIAGPAVNVVIAVVLFLVLGATLDTANLVEIENPGLSLLARLAAVNVILVVFNLIPAFPMDGGRVLRALLAMRRPHAEATRIAGRIGQAAAVAFAVIGLFWNPILLVIAIFVYLAASAEVEQVQMKGATRDATIGEAMVSVVETLSPGATLDDAVECLIRTSQKEFPVLDGAGRPRGLVTRDALIPALRHGSPSDPVLDVMARDVPEIAAGAPLAEGMRVLSTSGAPALFVLDPAGRLVGLLTRENLAEVMMVREARPDWPLHAPRGPGAWKDHTYG